MASLMRTQEGERLLWADYVLLVTTLITVTYILLWESNSVNTFFFLLWSLCKAFKFYKSPNLLGCLSNYPFIIIIINYVMHFQKTNSRPSSLGRLLFLSQKHHNLVVSMPYIALPWLFLFSPKQIFEVPCLHAYIDCCMKFIFGSQVILFFLCFWVLWWNIHIYIYN